MVYFLVPELATVVLARFVMWPLFVHSFPSYVDYPGYTPTWQHGDWVGVMPGTGKCLAILNLFKNQPWMYTRPLVEHLGGSLSCVGIVADSTLQYVVHGYYADPEDVHVAAPFIEEVVSVAFMYVLGVTGFYIIAKCQQLAPEGNPFRVKK